MSNVILTKIIVFHGDKAINEISTDYPVKNSKLRNYQPARICPLIGVCHQPVSTLNCFIFGKQLKLTQNS
jgi:hypothetical protein